MNPLTLEAQQLMLDGAKALAQMEHNGILVDEDYLNSTIQDVSTQIKELESDLQKDEIYKLWWRKYGTRTSLWSSKQLSHIFFKKLGYTSKNEKTRSGEESTEESAFEGIDLPFLKKYFRAKKLYKLRSTYLYGIKREVVDGFVHPVFNLHFATTFRSSADSPNVQNIIARMEEFAKIIRRCYIPREGRHFIEIDYGALEYRIAACVWNDPNMIAYASDPKLDIHRDKTAECYWCEVGQVTKDARSHGKNKFVFPLIYGSDYINISRSLWECIEQFDLKLVDGTPIKKHLKSKGITKLGDCDRKQSPVEGTFEHHIKSVQDKFYRDFPVFAAAKERKWAEYQEQGWFELVTGFRIQGVCSRNFLLNSVIQGPGFHCLLWSLIELQKWLNKYKMKTLGVAEIHDCWLADTPPDELQDVINQAEKIMTVDIRKHWSWLTAPLTAELDVVDIGSSWSDKKPWQRGEGGQWQPKTKK